MTDAYDQLRSGWAALNGATAAPRTVPQRILNSIEKAQGFAALTLWFNPVDLWRSIASPRDPDQRWLQQLRRTCSVDAADVTQWVMLDQERLPRLAQLAARGSLLAAAEEAARRKSDETAGLVAALLSGTFDPASSSPRVLAAAPEVLRWLMAIDSNVDLPGAATIAGAIELRARDAELGQLAHHIVGREDERRLLTQFIHSAWRTSSRALPLFRLEGIGGIGKSTLAADFARNALFKAKADAILIWVDYDKLRVRPEDIRTVVLEVARQLAWAIPERSEQLREARVAIRAMERISNDRTVARGAIDTLAGALGLTSGRRLKRAVLLVLDTFEQVERAPGQTADILGVLDLMRASLFEHFAVLACGRSVFSQGFGDVAVVDQTQPLQGLSREASRYLLIGRGGLGEHAADRLLDAFHDLTETEFRERIGVPMLLMLIARLIREKQFELDGRDLEEIRKAADGTMATAYIYGRVLSQVPKELRELAHPGLVLAEVSAESIENVIWPAVHGPENRIGPDRAETLFRRLQNETWLVESIPGSIPPRVRHRPDLRRAMLEKMRADPDLEVRKGLVRLHELAKRWHRNMMATSVDETERTQHMFGFAYHALQLSAITRKPSKLGISTVRAVRDQLSFAIEDFPKEYRPVVRALLGESIDLHQFVKLEPTLRTAVVADLTRAYSRRGDHAAALTLAEMLEPKDREHSPTLARLFVSAFIASGQWQSAERIVEPLLLGHNRRALDFGLAVPKFKPFMATYIIGGQQGITEVLKSHSRGSQKQSPGSRRKLFEFLFHYLDCPTSDLRGDFINRAGAFLVGQPVRRLAEDTLPIARAYGALLQADDPGRRKLPTFYAAARRGAFTCGVATLRQVESGERFSRTSAQWISACKSLDRKLERDERLAADLPLVPIFDEFHLPLGEGFAAIATEPKVCYRLAERAWDNFRTIRPPDLRPTVFAESCADPRARHERMRTLISFLDRSDQLGGYLKDIDIEGQTTAHEDLNRVIKIALKWRSAFADR